MRKFSVYGKHYEAIIKWRINFKILQTTLFTLLDISVGQLDEMLKVLIYVKYLILFPAFQEGCWETGGHQEG